MMRGATADRFSGRDALALPPRRKPNAFHVADSFVSYGRGVPRFASHKVA